jgi:hypothetical protein
MGQLNATIFATKLEAFFYMILYNKIIRIKKPSGSINSVIRNIYVQHVMRARSITRAMEGVGPGNRDFFGP